MSTTPVTAFAGGIDTIAHLVAPALDRLAALLGRDITE